MLSYVQVVSESWAHMSVKSDWQEGALALESAPFKLCARGLLLCSHCIIALCLEAWVKEADGVLAVKPRVVLLRGAGTGRGSPRSPCGIPWCKPDAVQAATGVAEGSVCR